MQKIFILTGIMTLTGCTVFYSIPPSPTGMADRLELSQQVIKRRKQEAQTLSLHEKAVILESRLLERFLLHPYALVSKYRKSNEIRGQIGPTSHYLAALAFQYAVTKNHDVRNVARRVIDSLRALDRSNGVDGYIPSWVSLEDGKLVVRGNETHSNAYSQLLFGFVNAHEHLDDPEIRQSIQQHVKSIAEYFLVNDLVLRDGEGRAVPHSNISPSLLQFSGSRCLDALVLAETTLNILSKQDSPWIERGMYEQHRKMVKSGYLQKIQNLQFHVFNFKLPTHSTDWINFIRLYTLTRVSDNRAYSRALSRLFRAQRGENNPLFAIIYLANSNLGEDEFLQSQINEYLQSFPITLDNAEIINSLDPTIQKKWIPDIVKLKQRAEAATPLPIYRRPLNPQEWKRNPYRLDGNFSRQGDAAFPGIDYLLVYWMGRFYDVVDAPKTLKADAAPESFGAAGPRPMGKDP